MRTLALHWPDKHSILDVYAVIVFLVYSWTLYASFWKVPSWIYFLNVREILSIYAYSFVFDLIDSMLLLAACLSIAFLFPFGTWREKFRTRSITFLIVFLGSIILRLEIYRQPEYGLEFVLTQKSWWLITFALLIFLVWLAPKLVWWNKLLDAFSDRCRVFLYIYAPLSILSVFVVILRNIF